MVASNWSDPVNSIIATAQNFFARQAGSESVRQRTPNNSQVKGLAAKRFSDHRLAELSAGLIYKNDTGLGKMILEIFDVEHGACALITTSNNRRIMIDCGDNIATGWKPATMLGMRGVTTLDRLIISNYDEDHVSGFQDLHSKVFIKVLQRNASVSSAAIRYLKSDDGMGSGIEALVHSIDDDFTGGPPAPIDGNFGDTSLSIYNNQYGALPGWFDDENNLSLVTFISCGAHKIIFPGDMEKQGWRTLLNNAAFRAQLTGVNIFVASHHGRENGYCQEVLDLCPNLCVVVISDKKMGFQSQETVDKYRAYARGFYYNGQERRVLTTRRDGNIRFDIPTQGNANVFLGLVA